MLHRYNLLEDKINRLLEENSKLSKINYPLQNKYSTFFKNNNRYKGNIQQYKSHRKYDRANYVNNKKKMRRC